MPSPQTITPPTAMSIPTVDDDPDTLRFTLRLMLDFHGPAAVINYATDHGIRCQACCTCGWSPHVNGECLLCDTAL
jgi:hypothetical protein